MADTNESSWWDSWSMDDVFDGIGQGLGLYKDYKATEDSSKLAEYLNNKEIEIAKAQAESDKAAVKFVIASAAVGLVAILALVLFLKK